MVATDIRSRLMGIANKEAIEAAQRANSIPGFLRERYPLASFEGSFTGEVREMQEQTPNGNTFSYPALGYKVSKVIRKFDANYQPGEVYWIRVDEPKPEQVHNSAIGHMYDAAAEAGVNLWDSKGQMVRLDIDSFKPFPNSKDEKYAKITTCFYKVSPLGEAEKTPAIDPKAEQAACEFASGLTAEQFTSEAIKALSAQGIDDEALFLEIASRTFLNRMVAEGKLSKDGEVYALA